jgi:hypothetical protein
MQATSLFDGFAFDARAPISCDLHFADRHADDTPLRLENESRPYLGHSKSHKGATNVVKEST